MRRFDLTAALIGLIFVALGVVLGGDALDWWRPQPGVVAASAVLVAGVAVVLGTFWRDRSSG